MGKNMEFNRIDIKTFMHDRLKLSFQGFPSIIYTFLVERFTATFIRFSHQFIKQSL